MFFLKIDPIVYLQKLTIPVLAIKGENDTQVEYQTNLKAIKLALDKEKNNHYTINTYP